MDDRARRQQVHLAVEGVPFLHLHEVLIAIRVAELEKDGASPFQPNLLDERRPQQPQGIRIQYDEAAAAESRDTSVDVELEILLEIEIGCFHEAS